MPTVRTELTVTPELIEQKMGRVVRRLAVGLEADGLQSTLGQLQRNQLFFLLLTNEHHFLSARGLFFSAAVVLHKPQDHHLLRFCRLELYHAPQEGGARIFQIVDDIYELCVGPVADRLVDPDRVISLPADPSTLAAVFVLGDSRGKPHVVFVADRRLNFEQGVTLLNDGLVATFLQQHRGRIGTA